MKVTRELGLYKNLSGEKVSTDKSTMKKIKEKKKKMINRQKKN